MTSFPNSLATPLPELAAYLLARREAILANWLTACESDPALPTSRNLSREEFNNKVPMMLNGFDEHLRGKKQEIDIKQNAAEHGLHRWHKGYALHELLAETKHLNQTLLNELRHYWQHYEPENKVLIAAAYEHLAWFNTLAVDGSVEQYTNLQQIAATDRVYTLQKALESIDELTRQRGDLLRSVTHDLRGSFGVIQGAASLLNKVNDSPEDQEKMLDMLSRNLNSVHEMVVQLMDLARLEAGQEVVNTKQVNVSELIRTQLATYQQLATERGLQLTADGPPDLLIESDSVLIQRILQNLVLNALYHTTSGMVSVSWAKENDSRWFVNVQDTGPGLPSQNANTLAGALIPTVDSPSSLGQTIPEPPLPQVALSGVSTGEGIGLSIVKRLCELLRANLDVESQPNIGTTFRIRFPIRWIS